MPDPDTDPSQVVPRLFALQRDEVDEDEEEDEPSGVVAWGLEFADGSVVTVWTGRSPGSRVAVSGSVDAVERLYAPPHGAHLVWHSQPGRRGRAPE